MEIHDEAPVELENSHSKNYCTNKEELIAREVKYAVKEMITNELSVIVQNLLDDIQRTSFHNRQGGIPSVVDKVVLQVMLDLLRKYVFGETVDAHIKKLFDTDAAAEGMLKSFPSPSSFMAPIETFVGCKMDTTMEEREYSTAFASKEPIDKDVEPLLGALLRQTEKQGHKTAPDLECVVK